MKLYKIVCLICMIVILNCNYKNVVGQANIQNEIKEGSVLRYGETDSFIIKFTNLIYEKNGKEIKIPIFRGNMGDVSYRAFHDYCYKNGLLQEGWGESGFVVKSEKGKLTTTFRDFLNFYKNNILKKVDINKPAKIKIFGEGDDLEIYYDFEANGIPFVLQIMINTEVKVNNPDLIKSMLQVNLNENKSQIFTYRFLKNKTSNDL